MPSIGTDDATRRPGGRTAFLEVAHCGNVSDLSPLRGMPLQRLSNPVRDAATNGAGN
jgi:hypothetical protein